MDAASFLENPKATQPASGRPLKVLTVCSARNGTYGAVVSMLTLCNQLRELGHQVEFSSFKGRGLGQVVQKLGYSDHPIPVRIKVDPYAIYRLARVIKDGGFDVVHSHLSTSCLIGGLAARLARVPGIATVHGMSSKGSFMTNSRLLAVSSEVRRHLIDQGVPPERITVVFNGVPETALPSPSVRAAAREALGLDPEDRVVGTTIRLVPAKGGHHALSAFARIHSTVPRAKLVIFGDGEQKPALMQLAEDLGVGRSVVFAGYRPDVRDLLPALEVFIFPSLKEAMGISVVEAMFAGLPIVSHNVGGLPEVVKDGMGYLVKPGDEQTMAKHVCDLLFEEDLRQKFGRAARDRAVQEFSALAMATHTVDAYKQAISLARR